MKDSFNLAERKDGTIVGLRPGALSYMTTMSTTRRTVYDIALAVAVSFSLIFATSARSANGGQEDQGKSKTMKKTASGLQYLDEKVGTGETPKTGQTCIMHYTGWLWEKNAKGKKFDSSKDRNEPFSFDIGKGEVIKGWDEGVATMKVGGKRHLLIPANLGYGARGPGERHPSQCDFALRGRVARNLEHEENRQRPRVPRHQGRDRSFTPERSDVCYALHWLAVGGWCQG